MAEAQEFERKQNSIRRNNLLCISRMCIKSLVDKASFEMIMDDCPYLHNLCIALEHILKHRMLSTTRGFLFSSESSGDPWEAVKLFATPSSIACVADMEEVTTNIGKLRVWIKLSLVQKKLAESMANAPRKLALLSQYYHDDAFLCCESATILAGNLRCLDAVDFNLCLREPREAMKERTYEVDYASYLVFRQSKSSEADDEVETHRLKRLSHSDRSTPPAHSSRTPTPPPHENVLQLKEMVKTERDQRNYYEELVKVRDHSLRQAEERYRTDTTASEAQLKQLEAVVLELQQTLQEKQDEISRLKKKGGK